ncbi:shikimate dehydrogenase [Candidatus Photodesmus katoptron]|uniref:shikimate dehydrogenase n=1 Tax=Candidatus Photodesmus anomalopis TaxID=28176 RepID=UPI000552EA11|nr:shikimate dehydrogenase [Candidatus Photodesmus katoptron]
MNSFKQPDAYAVFGNPIKHSKSPLIHSLFMKQTKEDIIYTANLVPINSFFKVIQTFFKLGGKGCNITLPFKKKAFQFSDKLTKRAQFAGAVNTLKKLDDGRILGDNTDGEGLVRDLLSQSVILKKANILLIGAGGAAQGVLKPLLERNPMQIVIANRTLSKAEQLAKKFQLYGNVLPYNFNNLNNSFDLVINSTSASLKGEIPKISPRIFNSKTISYDMNYQNRISCFNQWAKINNVIHIYDGLGMLVEQAAESFLFWRGIKPHTKAVIQKLKNI